MDSFSNFYNNYKKTDTKDNTLEGKFEYATGIKTKSVDAFIAWLIINRKLKTYINSKTNRPVSIYKLEDHKKILYLVDNLSNIKDLVTTFNKIF